MNNNLTNKQFLEIQTMFLSACEELCNRALRYDEASRQAFAELEGKVLSVETYVDLPFGRTELSFFIMFCENGLIFSSINDELADEIVEGDVDVRIKASSLSLFSRLFTQKDLLDGDIDIQGERILVSKMQAILSELNIDWEEPLSRITGDVLAHEINRFAQDATRWLKNSGSIFESFLGRANKKYSVRQAAGRDQNTFEDFKRDVAELSALEKKLSTRVENLLSKNQGENSLGERK